MVTAKTFDTEQEWVESENEYPKISIVIPYYKNEETITNLIESIKDQDYKNYDITVVLDGFTKEDDDLLKELSKESEFQYLQNKENKGAPNARNLGAKNTDGEILFFVDADCQLYPGTLYECVKQFLNDTKVSFVYGNYRFDNSRNYTSKPFDRDELRMFNYISTMSPIKRSVFDEIGGFREDLKFFQDWDLFYRASEKGHYGKWINEFLFSTELPNEDNISGSQKMTLAEKVAYFYNINEIEPNSLVVTTFSAQLQAQQRAKMLGADYCGQDPVSHNHAKYPVNLDLKNWKATFMIGLFNHPQEAINKHFSIMKGKRIIQFIGTDVWQLRNCHSFADLDIIKKELRKENTYSFVNSPRMQEELKEMGFDAELLYAPIYNLEKYKVTKQFPEKDTVAVYFSDTPNMNELEGKGGMSNIPLVIDAARACPDIEFKFFGDKGKLWKNKKGEIEYKRDNIEFCGRIPNNEMIDFINECSCILRCTIHDGFPQLPIQFMLCGRDSIVSVPDKQFKANVKLSFEEPTDYMAHKNELISAIYECALKERPSKKDTEVTSTVKRAYYSDLCNETKFRERIFQCLKK